MPYILGIDQGGSKTHAIVMDGFGTVLGLGKSQGACYANTGLDVAMNYIKEASDRALGESGLSYEQMNWIVAGLTGADWDYEVELLTEALRKQTHHDNVYVVNDCIIAMRAGTSGTVSGILCAGSGFNCAVRNGDDMFTYGYYVPDDCAGGSALARATLRAVYDGELGLNQKTALRELVLDFFRVSSVDELLLKDVTGQLADSEVLRLPVLLQNAALEGDPVAKDIWTKTGKRMAQCMTARIRKMHMEYEPVEVVLSGSVFKCRAPQLIESVTGEILDCAPNAVIISAEYEPIVGAALLGLDKIHGNALPTQVYQNLEASAEVYAIKRFN